MVLWHQSHKRLDEFVLEQVAEAERRPGRATYFGMSTRGRYVSPWTMNIERLGFFFNAFTVANFRGDACVRITVPCTERGISPVPGMDTFGWDGKINEHAAETAVWWAFEILDDAEARRFLTEELPAVIFSYMEGFQARELRVRFNGEFWVIESLN